jgi:hypothetical protein
MKSRSGPVRSLRRRKLPRRMAWRVMMPKKISTIFSHEHPAGEVPRDPRRAMAADAARKGLLWANLGPGASLPLTLALDCK